VTDYYRILQVSEGAEPDVIDAAYKKLIFKYHPDRNTSAGAKHHAQLLIEAYEHLSDPIKRSAHDRARKQSQAEQKATFQDNGSTSSTTYQKQPSQRPTSSPRSGRWESAKLDIFLLFVGSIGTICLLVFIFWDVGGLNSTTPATPEVQAVLRESEEPGQPEARGGEVKVARESTPEKGTVTLWELAPADQIALCKRWQKNRERAVTIDQERNGLRRSEAEKEIENERVALQAAIVQMANDVGFRQWVGVANPMEDMLTVTFEDFGNRRRWTLMTIKFRYEWMS
jgi:curved DNA-binding protein CbpA